MVRLLIFTILLFSCGAHADEALWTDNKITPSQPFPGRILAVDSGWGGYRLVIESNGEGEKRFCLANVVPPFVLNYTEIAKADLSKLGGMMVFLNPSIEVDNFSWSMGVHRIGKTFGEEDFVRKAVAIEAKRRNLEGKQEAAERGPSEIQDQGRANQRAREEFKHVDAQLTEAFEKTLAAESSPQLREALIASQQTWLSFRGADGRYESVLGEGGSARSQSVNERMTYLTRLRIYQLETPFAAGWPALPQGAK
jgi:uncharacterized protein YecT (DUF1311 family)